ncbi:MAG: tetratricopeptide repeat protein, partial [Myxococcota bacterium]
AMLHSMEGRHTEAVELCDQSIAALHGHGRSSAFIILKALRGRIILALGQLEEAVDALTDAIALSPSQFAIEPLLDLAQAYLRLGRFGEAKEARNRAATLGAGVRYAGLLSLTDARLAQVFGDLDLASEACDRAIAQFEHSRRHYELGQARCLRIALAQAMDDPATEQLQSLQTQELLMTLGLSSGSDLVKEFHALCPTTG